MSSMRPPTARIFSSALGAFVLALLAFALWGDNQTTTASQEEPQVPPVKTTAPAIFQAFGDPAVAQSKFGGKKIEISGTVSGVDEARWAILLETGATDYPVRLLTSGKDEAAAPIKGMLVTAMCEQATQIEQNVFLKGCRLR